MCKAYPGLRCSDNVSKRIEKIGVQLGAAKKDDEEIRQATKQHKELTKNLTKPDPNHEALTIALQQRKKESAEKISNLQQKFDLELSNYDATTSGIKKIQTEMDNPRTKIAKKIELSGRKDAATTRRELHETAQKSLNRLPTPQQKHAYSKASIRKQDDNIMKLRKELNLLEIRKALDPPTTVEENLLYEHRISSIRSNINQARAFRSETAAYNKKIEDRLFKGIDLIANSLDNVLAVASHTIK